jgi:intracellular multiplication protein IcmB
MIASYATSSGRFTQLQLLSLGPIELWSFQSDPDSALLINLLYERNDPAKVRRILSKRFPAGSCDDEIQRRKATMSDNIGTAGSSINESIVKMLAQEIQADLLRMD